MASVQRRRLIRLGDGDSAVPPDLGDVVAEPYDLEPEDLGQLFTSSPSVTHLSSTGLTIRTSLAVVGLGLIGIGSGLYMAARFGAGPRDSLMVVLAQRTPVRIALVRIALELAATAE
jgi:hypothetical protein